MVTPCTTKGELDVEAAERLASRFAAADAAPFILGTTGEGHSVPRKEKERLAVAVVGAVGGKQPVYASISDNCLQDSIELANCFFELGVTAVVAHPPFYYPISDEGLIAYFERLADSLPGPLVLYNIPSTTRVSIPLEVVERLSHHPRIVGLKDSERDLDRLERAAPLWAGREDFSFLIGWAAKSLHGLRLGAKGIVPNAGNVVPELFRDLYEAAISGQLERASELQDKADRVAAIYQRDRNLSQSLAALKGMLQVLGLCGESVWPPLLPLGKGELAGLETKMRELGLM
jgi:4-hydroxy-tetrahydrodipicolinate synthase